MKVLYFGSYDPNYTRNRVLITGLRQNGVEVIECRDNSPGIQKFIRLYQKHRKLRGQYDVMVVGFLGQQILPFAKLICRKPIILDAFLSLYDSNVFDRKVAKKGSLRSFYYWMLDWLSMKLADLVLFDTEQHIKYASKEFGIKINKFRRLWIGAADDVLYPVPRSSSSLNGFLVIFYGSYIPLQGVGYILKAAKICEKEGIKFLIIGDGQEKKKMLNLADKLNLTNVEFVGFMKQDWIREKVAEADVCLGIFGDTQKTLRVIPNKVYECLAMQKPVVTADTPAARELFDEGDLLMVRVADSESLANGILRLKNDLELRDRIAINGFNKFKNRASPHVLGGELKNIINGLK